MQTFYAQKTVGDIKNIGVAYILHDTYIYNGINRPKRMINRDTS